MTADLIATQEVYGWWSAERGRVDRECRAAATACVRAAHDRIDALGLGDVVLRGRECKNIEKELESEINAFSHRLSGSVEKELGQSLYRIEGSDRFSDAGIEDVALLGAGGALGLGGVGIAAAATTAATTSSAMTVLFGTITIGTVSTFSWPVFLGMGTVATAAVFLSPRVLDYGRGRLVNRYKAFVQRTVDAALVTSSASDSPGSTREQLLAHLDAIRDRRLSLLQESDT